MKMYLVWKKEMWLGFGQNTVWDSGNVIVTRDSIKFGNGCEIGKENDIGDVTEVQDPLFQTPSLGWQFYYNINIKSVSVKIVRAWNSTKQEENSQNHFHVQNNTYCLRETKLWEARFCKGRGS